MNESIYQFLAFISKNDFGSISESSELRHMHNLNFPAVRFAYENRLEIKQIKYEKNEFNLENAM